MNKRRCSEPNIQVELWKDAIYEETMALSGKDLDCYFKDKADTILKSCRLTLRKSKLHKETNLLTAK